MSDRDENPLTSLEEFEPIIKKQNMESDIYILGESPIFSEKDLILINKDTDIFTGKDLSKNLYFNKIDKTNASAKKFKNKIFLGTDGNYYISKKNKKGDYVWVLVEKK